MRETKVSQDGDVSPDILDFLKNIPIFDSLDPEELEVVSTYMKLMDVNPGEIVFKEGAKGSYVCFVAEGSLDVLKQSETGSNITIATLDKGRSIGEMAVIDDFPRSATIKAQTKATLIILTRDEFDLILEEHSKTGVKILKGISRLLSHNLRKTSSRLVEYMLPLS